MEVGRSFRVMERCVSVRVGWRMKVLESWRNDVVAVVGLVCCGVCFLFMLFIRMDLLI